MLTASCREHFSLSLTICRMRLPESRNLCTPSPLGHFILQALNSQASKCFHMSTLTCRAPYLRLYNAASQLCFRALDGLPVVLGQTSIPGPPGTMPRLHQKISLPRVVVSPSPSSSSSLSSAESSIGLFGVCRVQGMLSFSENAVSQPCCLFWPFSEDAAGIIGELLLLLSATQGSQFQRGVWFRRHELSS